MIKKIQLFPNHNQKSQEIYELVRNKLLENHFEVVDRQPDLAIAIGGDGSFLRMIKKCNFNSDIYYIGIHAGTLGFLQEVNPDEIDYLITSLQNHDFKIEHVGIQETKVITDTSQSLFFSLNEIVIRDKKLNTTELDININENLLERFVGDGILISTSVGSTAYNLSYGGSIVYSNLHTLQITPVAPLNSKSYHSLSNSVVVSEEKTISLFPLRGRDIIITVDGENKIYENVERIETKVKDKKIRCLRLSGYNFTNIINDKFLNYK